MYGMVRERRSAVYPLKCVRRMSTRRADDPGTDPAQEAPGLSLFRRWPRWFRWSASATAVGLTLSVTLHIVVGLIAAGIVVSSGPRGSGRGERGVEVALDVMSETELTTLEEAPLGAQTPTDEVLPEFAPPQVDLTGGMTDTAPSGGAGLTEVEGLGGAGLGGAGEGTGDGLEDGGGFGGGSGGGGGAKFFGVEARGSRFAYIVDVSGSMAGPKLEALKEELAKSLDGLVSNSSFVVMLYSSGSSPMGGRARWTESNDKNKKTALGQIERISASGATNPSPAFEEVFAMRPRPDAIYFMTDGLFNAEVAQVVARLNGTSEQLTPVHAISFVSRESETLLRRIAEDSDGTYTHIPGPSGALP